VAKTNAISYSFLIKGLMDGTKTARELAEETGLTLYTVYGHLNELKKRGAIHIVFWERDTRGRECMPIYMLGKGTDVKKKPPKTKTEKSREWRARHGIGAKNLLNGLWKKPKVTQQLGIS
jgi:predicted transcriptional regulator